MKRFETRGRLKTENNVIIKTVQHDGWWCFQVGATPRKWKDYICHCRDGSNATGVR